MQAVILQENLNKGLAMVGRVVATRAQLPVLANVLIEAEKGGVILSATNLEIGLRMNVGGKVIEEGAITVPARNLGEFVNSIGSGNVELVEKEGKLKVTSGKFGAVFAGIAAAEFPVMPRLGATVGKSKKTSIARAVVEQIAGQVAYAAAADESRPVLTGVQFKNTEGKLVVVATDGFRMSKKIVGGENLGFAGGLILPARTILELARIIGEGRKGEVEMEAIAENNQVVFGYDEVQLVSRVLEGNFPDVEKIIPVDTKTAVIVEREELLKAVKAVAIFARDGANIVKLAVSDNKIIIEAAAQQTGESRVEVEAEGKGEEGIIAFNYKYITDFLGSVTGERVTFRMNGSLAPGMWGVENDESLVHIVMPVRV